MASEQLNCYGHILMLESFQVSARGHIVELKNSILKFLCFIIHNNNFYKSTLSPIQGVESSVAKWQKLFYILYSLGS